MNPNTIFELVTRTYEKENSRERDALFLNKFSTLLHFYQFTTMGNKLSVNETSHVQDRRALFSVVQLRNR